MFARQRKIYSLIPFLLFLFQISACAPMVNSVENTSQPDITKAGDISHVISKQQADIYTVENPEGVVLMIHGLNLKPSKMSTLAYWLNDEKYEVVNVILSGHSEKNMTAQQRLNAFRNVSLSVWRNEVMTAYKFARERADKKNIPLILVGFSLGGALGVDITSSLGHRAFAKQILFSPAIAINTSSWFLRPFEFFPGLVIPSFSPARYRANYGTPMAGYTALYSLIGDLSGKVTGDHNSSTLIIIDPDDELVSVRGLKTFIRENDLTAWSLMEVAKSEDSVISFSHLTIDPESLGNRTWKSVTDRIKIFLSSPP